MRIIEGKVNRNIALDALASGAVFTISSLMKNDDNAVCLSDGFTLFRFSDDEYVIEIPAELHFTIS